MQEEAMNTEPIRSVAASPQTTDVAAAKEALIREITSWEGVTTGEHRFGGKEFKIGHRELGHLHPGFADLPFPLPVRNELIAAGRATPHHVIPNSGWVTAPMRTVAQITNVGELFRLNYEIAVHASQETESDLKAPFFY